MRHISTYRNKCGLSASLQSQKQQQLPSPDSASLSDSLSSSELELLETFAWFCPAWPSSSSSSAGVLCKEGGGCFSRSWSPIFSLLLIREIEVLQGRGQGGVERQVACRELISEGNHSMCSQLEHAPINHHTSKWNSGRLFVSQCLEFLYLPNLLTYQLISIICSFFSLFNPLNEFNNRSSTNDKTSSIYKKKRLKSASHCHITL